jgi:hypothetical protein
MSSLDPYAPNVAFPCREAGADDPRVVASLPVQVPPVARRCGTCGFIRGFRPVYADDPQSGPPSLLERRPHLSKRAPLFVGDAARLRDRVRAGELP